MKRSICSLLNSILFLIMVVGCATERPEIAPEDSLLLQKDLPRSPDLVEGKLNNGFSYIILKNDRPKNRADLRLIVRAGSVLEDETQQGFAHFIEHMGFNGTQDFDKQSIREYIESIGMKPGAHLNATTSFDETIYKLFVPTDKSGVLDKSLHIMENWAHKISFDPEEIDKERGVIIEEWRNRKGARSRVSEKQLPIIFKGSQYAQRNPIGKEDIILKGKHEDMLRFYKDWYRPELMSIVAVGDFDPEYVKELIEKHFSSLPKSDDGVRPRKIFSVPANKRPLVTINIDPEITESSVSIKVKKPFYALSNYGDYRKKISKILFIGVLNSRLTEEVLAGKTAMRLANSGFSPMSGRLNIFSLNSRAKTEKTKETFQALLREVYRIAHHGVTETELSTKRNDFLKEFEKKVSEKRKYNSRRLAATFTRNLLSETPNLSDLLVYELLQQLLPIITSQDFKLTAKELLTKDNSIIVINSPEKEKASLPSEDQLMALWQEVSQEVPTPYVDTVVPESLMKVPPSPGTIVSKTYDEALATHTWVLNNGARVVLKPTDFQKHRIHFVASSPGGRSLLDPDMLYKTNRAFDL